MGSARRLVGGVAGLVAGAAKHAFWYLSYQVGGQARAQPERADEDEGQA